MPSVLTAGSGADPCRVQHASQQVVTRYCCRSEYILWEERGEGGEAKIGGDRKEREREGENEGRRRK
jgi:hypothetical protein